MAFCRSTFFLDGFVLYCSGLSSHLGRSVILSKMIQRAPKRNQVKLIQYCFMKSFADAVCLRVSGLGFGVFYVIDAKVAQNRVR